MRRPGVVLALLTIGLAGCVGDSGPVCAADCDGPPMATMAEGLGAIEGQVLDEEQRPVEGASVAIPSLELATTTDASGAFALADVAPGNHDLLITASGYASILVPIQVVAGEVTQVTRSLGSVAAEGPHAEIFPFVGFEACQWYLPVALAHCTLPYTQVHGTLARNGVNLSQAGLPRDFQDNRDKYNFTVRLDHTGIVSELIWQPSSAAATWQALVLACAWYDPTWDECVPPGEVHTGERYYGIVGTSPIRLQWKHERPEHLPWVMSRANVNGNATDLRPAGFALDQRIEMYNTVFYGVDPPEGYTAGPPDA